MATYLSINPQLLQEALRIGGLKTKKDTVNLALQEFIQRRKAVELIALFGTIDYDPTYDYKQGRRQTT